jgi:haloacetate dehalogenase
MSDLADLFPGFASHWIDVDIGKIFARVGGNGPPVLLLHGFPQTHVMWHAVAPNLAERFTVVAMDLRGYGWSAVPEGSQGGSLYSKREMAKDAVSVMESLGHVHFACVGHDRGARVAYRLELDHPGRLSKLALVDIMPTVTMWDRMDAKRAMQVYHWTFLAQPAPVPERLIGADPLPWLDHTLASWTRDKSLKPFDRRALDHYRAFFNNPDRIHATCEDYRAGATIDPQCDRDDIAAGKRIGCPTAVIWGASGIPAAGASPLDIWRQTFAPQATGTAVDSGHFVPEENPAGMLDALMPFLGE